MISYLKESEKIMDEVISSRRYLHQHPEIADELPNTVNFVTQKLKALGYEPKEICKNGIVALVGKDRSKTFLLRADMDALPMKEESGLPFASQNEYAHTCGHDLHTAMLLGAARILKEHESELNGTVKLMFQPDEEALTGGVAMMEAGVLENPHVDAAAAIHVFPGDLHTGCLACSPGPVMASSDRFSITVKGHGAHGALPHESIDPITAACHIQISLQEIIAREVNAKEPIVITVGSFHAGDAPNIIPETAVLEGSIRAYSRETREYAKKRLEEIALLTAQKFRAECKVVFTGGTSPTMNDPKLSAELAGYLQDVVKVIPFQGLMSSDDFSLVCDRVPAVYLALGAGGEDPIYHKGLAHHPTVIFNEDAMKYGVASLVCCAVEWLKNH